jgi:predicted nucleotidyltransferase
MVHKRDYNVDVNACRESFIARLEKRLSDGERRRQNALEAALSATAAILPRYSAVRRAYLFGSVLRSGAFRLDSDIDIAVEGVKAADYFALWGDLEEAMPEWTLDVRDLIPGSEFGQRVRAKGLLIHERENTGTES